MSHNSRMGVHLTLKCLCYFLCGISVWQQEVEGGCGKVGMKNERRKVAGGPAGGIMKTCSDSAATRSTCVCNLCLCMCLCALVKGLAQSGPNQAFNTADHQYLISIHL